MCVCARARAHKRCVLYEIRLVIRITVEKKLENGLIVFNLISVHPRNPSPLPPLRLPELSGLFNRPVLCHEINLPSHHPS